MSTVFSAGADQARALAVRLWLATAGLGMAFFVAYTLGLGGSRLDAIANTWVYNGLTVLALAAVATRAVVAREERLVWALLTAGIVCQVLGDLSWSVLYGGNPPFPSIADVFYLGFFPPTYLAFALLVKHRVSRFNASVWLDGRWPPVGQRILAVSPALNRVGEIVRATHERSDGQGYPDRLSGDAIPLPARIVGVCDAYSAMTSGRPYRHAMTPAAALDELRLCAGAQFDPEIVRAFGAMHIASASGIAGP